MGPVPYPAKMPRAPVLTSRHANLETRDVIANRDIHNISAFTEKKYVPPGQYDLTPPRRYLSPSPKLFSSRKLSNEHIVVNNTAAVSDTFGSSFNQSSRKNLENIREMRKPGTIGWNSDPKHYD